MTPELPVSAKRPRRTPRYTYHGAPSTQHAPCSGQSGSFRHWGIYREDGPPWWRARTVDGRIRLFASYKAAQRAADRLNVEAAGERR